MEIKEIFCSYQGEGYNFGKPVIFVRFAGCNYDCAWCFGPNTLGRYPNVTLLDGTKKAINEVRVGEYILTLNEKRELVATQVTQVLAHDSDKYELLTFPHTRLTVTPEHPFYVKDKGFTTASELVAGEDSCYKVDPYQYALFEVLNPENLAILRAYTQQVLELWEKIGKLNKGERNGNYRADFPYRNLHKLKYMLRHKYITQTPLEDDPKSLVVHHLDHNPDNDAPENLVLISRRLHDKLHARGYNFGRATRQDNYVPLLNHTRNYGEGAFKRLVGETRTFINLSCAPYNTFLIDDIYVHNCDEALSRRNNKVHHWIEAADVLTQIDGLMAVNNCRSIIFTGGEPSLYYDDIKTIIDHCNSLYGDMWYGCESNGTGSYEFYRMMDFTCISPKYGQTKSDNFILCTNNILFNGEMRIVIDQYNEEFKQWVKSMLTLGRSKNLRLYLSPVTTFNGENMLDWTDTRWSFDIKDTMKMYDELKKDFDLRISLQAHKLVGVR